MVGFPKRIWSRKFLDYLIACISHNGVTIPCSSCVCLGRVLDTASNLILHRSQLEVPWYMDRHLHKCQLHDCLSTGARAVPLCEAIQAAEPATIPLPAPGRKIFVSAYPVLHIKINEQNKVGLPPSVILTDCFCPRTSRNVELFFTPGEGKKEEPVLGQTFRADYALGCLACGMLLSVFVAPADFSPISMFYGLPNVFSLQKSVHLATLALTPLFTPCCFSEGMCSLPQKCLEKLLSKTGLKLQGVPCLCFSDLFTKYCTGSGAIFYVHTRTV